MTSVVATAVIRSRAIRAIRVEVITLPYMMWSLMNPEGRRQCVKAFDALVRYGIEL